METRARNDADYEVEQSFDPVNPTDRIDIDIPDETEPDQVSRDAEAAAAEEQKKDDVVKKAEELEDFETRRQDETREQYQTRAQKRINKEIGRRKTAEERSEELAQENARLKAQLEGKPLDAKETAEPEKKEGPEVKDIDLGEMTPKPLSKEDIHQKAVEMTGKKPNEDDFEDFDAYNEALTDWKVDVRIAETRLAEEDRKRIEGESGKLKTFIDRLASGEKKYKDYAKTITDVNVQITRPMIAFMQDCEKVAEITYYLGKNPIEAAKIARMNPVQQQREILKLEAKFIADPNSAPPYNFEEEEKAEDAETNEEGEEEELTEPDKGADEEIETPPVIPKKKISAAPEPIKPIHSGAVSGNKDPEKMSPDEYRKWREGGGGR